MRKEPIAVATVILLVGIAAGYGWNRFRNPPRATGQNMEGRAEAGRGATGETQASRRASGAEDPSGRAATVGPRVPGMARSAELDPKSAAGRVSARPTTGRGGETTRPRDAVDSRTSSEDRGPDPAVGAAGNVRPAPGSSAGASSGIAPAPAPAPPPAILLPPSVAATSDTTADDTGAEPQDGADPEDDDPESDRQAPVLEYLRFDPPEIPDGSVAVLSVAASDDLSGPKIATGMVQSPSDAATIQFIARDESSTGVLTARIAIPGQAEAGNWFVRSLRLLDRADNILALEFAKATVPPGGVLRVYSRDSDSTAPDVRRVSIDRQVVGVGESNRILVEVDDDRSGVGLVQGVFEGPSRSTHIPFFCRANAESSSWEGEIPIPANADCGEWRLTQLRVADKAGNTAVLTTGSPQLGRVSFSVSGGGGCDSVPPTVGWFDFSPRVVSNAEPAEIVVTVTAHDEGSGVEALYGRVQGPVATNGEFPRLSFSCKPDPNAPEAPMTTRLSVPRYAAKGIWKLDWVQVVDKARNARTHQGADPVLSNLGFIVE